MPNTIAPLDKLIVIHKKQIPNLFSIEKPTNTILIPVMIFYTDNLFNLDHYRDWLVFFRSPGDWQTWGFRAWDFLLYTIFWDLILWNFNFHRYTAIGQMFGNFGPGGARTWRATIRQMFGNFDS